MKYIKILVVILLFGFIAHAQAQKALSKNLIQAMKVVMAKMASIEEKYPQLFAEIEAMEMSEPNDILNFIKKSKAYPEISAMVTRAGFDSLEEFNQLTNRISGSMMAYQQQQMPKGMNFNDMNKMLAESIKQMKKSNAPSSMIAKMQQQLDKSKADVDRMELAAKSASVEDIKFVKENVQWIMSVLDEEGSE